MQLGFAIILADEAHNALRRLQLAVAGACGRNPALRQNPHVTLKQPFTAKSLGPIETYFDTLVPSIEPFEIHLSGLGTFDDDGVIYLSIVDQQKLDELRRRILAELLDRFRVKPRAVEGDAYRFHATVAYGLTQSELAAGMKALTEDGADLTFTTEQIGLFYNTGEEWIIYKLARLAPIGNT